MKTPARLADRRGAAEGKVFRFALDLRSQALDCADSTSGLLVATMQSVAWQGSMTQASTTAQP